MIDTFVVRAELQSPHEEGQALRKQQAEALKMIEQDKNDLKGLFGGIFNKKSAPMAIYDPEDGVMRCPECNWEIEDRQCPHCGRRFHASDMPDSDASDASDFSDEDSEEEEDDDDDDSISVSDRSGMDDEMHDLDDDEDSEIAGAWEVDYDEDHQLALALQDEYHREFMRHLGMPEGWAENQFGIDRVQAARRAVRDRLSRGSRGISSSPGRSLHHSSPYSRDSDEDSEENTLDEEDSEFDDFIEHDTPERRTRRHTTARTLRRHARRSVADLSDDDDDDEDEDDESIVGGRRPRSNPYYDRRRPIIISSDNDDDDEEAAGLINRDEYARLDHDTTTGDDDDDDDSLGESEIGQILRPAGPLRASTMPASSSSISARRTLREQVVAEQQRTETPPATRRRRRTVTFQVPEDADGENDSDARDDDGDLDMDRHSRAGSTSLASTSSNRADAGTRQQHSGGNHFQQDTPSVNEDESSDDSPPRQRTGRRRIGTASSSNLRRAATAHPNPRRLNHTSTSVNPTIHRLLRNFNAQRNESQLEQLGRSAGLGENDLTDLASLSTSMPRSASRDLEELNEAIVISSSPAPNSFPTNNDRQSSVGAAPTRESSVFSTISANSRASREQSVLSNESTATQSILTAQVQQVAPTISTVPTEPSAWDVAAATPNGASTGSGTGNQGSTNTRMRQRRSNAALRTQDPQRSSTPTTRQNSRATRAQTDREDIHRRARDFLARRTQHLAERAAQGTTAPTRSTRNTTATNTLTTSTERIGNGRDSVTPTPSTQSQATTEDSPAQRGITRVDTGGATGRRRGYQIAPGSNRGPLFVISDSDDQ
ncbi:hypothetical protein ABW19_dt0209493 [Dactylella cylindrospora]|nr:hypothetical protein ABW19_dt0209493 [Dactylella cylindrospora]